uniref:PolyADP-ribose polymerase n=1 Tax=Marseillevirus LCMAC101 TaxID=2506602 RepID=A0A481YQH3_9VIRU|nr:MAG: polyADP-ribose polymerase [Marseillevirus LCMAC101]
MADILDKYCNLGGASICKDSTGIYSCTLNQTNIGNNNNKFYIIQVVEDRSGVFYVYSRYGRVGERGIPQEKRIGSEDFSKALTIKEFKKRFRSKTGNVWGVPFVHKPGKYMLMEMEEPEVEEKDVDITETKLNPKVADVISLIGDKKTMQQTMQSMDVDTKKLPLGKISKQQIDKGFQTLEMLKKFIHPNKKSIRMATKDPNAVIAAHIDHYSSQFWTLIPYACGRNRPPLIDTDKKLEYYAELLEVLKNIQIATKILSISHNLDEIYDSLGISLAPVKETTKAFQVVNRYITNTHASTHNYKLELLEVFSIGKPSQDEKDVDGSFKKASDHRLLIHGSRMANFMGILSEGLRVPKSSQVSNGSVLGRGIYFADSISKSFNYCYAYNTNDIGFIILCEAALGSKPHGVYQATHDDQPGKEYTSRIARGCSAPESTEILNIKKTKVTVPTGKLTRDPECTISGFLYNEYVIFDTNLYRFRYLLKIKSSS